MTLSDGGQTTTKTINSVETSFRLVEALRRLDDAGVSELADELELPPSTTYIHLNTLMKLGYVIKDDHRYRLSFQFLNLGGSVRKRFDMYQRAQEAVDLIARYTGETAGFGTTENGMRVILYRAKGQHAVADNKPLGDYSYMHHTSIGKAMLAYLPEAEIDEIIDRYGLPAATPNTITDREHLEAELERVRTREYALDDEEHIVGIRGIAVPVQNEAQEVHGAIGVAGPKRRFRPSYLTRLLEVLNYNRNVIELKHSYYG
ncbi:IclR family transcriptional regulator [Natrononativus amylolyticus]|uniref:IclR family transcriptional regulator n=1 Tax=Natrononativus amylolyticus TaxID=2963434 RepID=UPI0020CD4F48|nr:IclR family transcriptional regulator [Natrononativus amylolyticus]